MLRSRHFYGYATLATVVLSLSLSWWYDHSCSAARIVNLDDEVDHLIYELRKTGANIERMAGGGFRRIYLPPGYKLDDLPPGYQWDENAPLQTVPFTTIGARIAPPSDRSQPLPISR